LPPGVKIGWGAYNREGTSSLRGLFLQDYKQLSPGVGREVLVDLLNYHISMGPSRVYLDENYKLLTKDGGHFTNHFDQKSNGTVQTRRLYMLNHGVKNGEVDRTGRLLRPTLAEAGLPRNIHTQILAYENSGNAAARAALDAASRRVEAIELRTTTPSGSTPSTPSALPGGGGGFFASSGSSAASGGSSGGPSAPVSVSRLVPGFGGVQSPGFGGIAVPGSAPIGLFTVGLHQPSSGSRGRGGHGFTRGRGGHGRGGSGFTRGRGRGHGGRRFVAQPRRRTRKAN
jgi:hypothetical protein